MYPTTILGSVTVVLAARYALRPTAGARAIVPLVLATLCSGLLGTLSGFIATFRYVAALDAPGSTILVGLAESLHNTTLALIFGVLIGLFAAIGRHRSPG